MKLHNRSYDKIRKLTVIRQYTKYAEGSILISLGDTKILCNASVIKHTPSFLKKMNQGWLTAEYNMLPRSTCIRNVRDSNNKKANARNLEIQRFIGRSLRSSLNLNCLLGYTIYIDCDVIQADGSTRSAAVIGSSIALYEAIMYMKKNNMINKDYDVFKYFLASISVGIYQEQIMFDLDYYEDKLTDIDMNIVMNTKFEIIEIQGNAEKKSLSSEKLFQMINLSKQYMKDIFDYINKLYNL